MRAAFRKRQEPFTNICGVVICQQSTKQPSQQRVAELNAKEMLRGVHSVQDTYKKMQPQTEHVTRSNEQ